MIDPQIIINKAKEFVSSTSYLAQLLENVRTGKNYLIIDFNDIIKEDIELADSLLDDFEETVKAIGIACESLEIGKDVRIKVRIRNIPDSQEIKISEIRAHHLNKLIKFKGLVRLKDTVEAEAHLIKFECPSCYNIISIIQTDDKIKEPNFCSCGRKGKFKQIDKEMVDVQGLVVEEPYEYLEVNLQPQKANVILKEDLTTPDNDKRIYPGCRVSITGVLKPMVKYIGKAISKKIKYIVEANWIEPLDEDIFEKNITKEDEDKIIEFSKSKDLFPKLISMIAPSIYGHELIKEAMLLQMVGGVTEIKQDKTRRRGEIHILIVGDPGIGKSVMAQSVLKLKIRSRYVSGGGASGAGITAAVIKNEATGNYGLEAGAMVLANGSLLVADELEKMNENDRNKLHEAMEAGTVHISKANIQATLKCETSILGIANPEYGRFSEFEPIPSQINLAPSLISRFDLIEIVKDIPDEKKDREMAEFILDQKQKKLEDIDYTLFRKYIIYASRLKPVLGQTAKKILSDYFVKLRTKNIKEEGSKAIAITPRQLEGLIRLSEASAKLRLSNIVEREDAERATKLMDDFLRKIGMDPETGEIDIDRIQASTTSSERKKIEVIMKYFYEHKTEDIPFEQLIEYVKQHNITEMDLDKMIEKLKKNGDLMEPKPGILRLVT